MAQFSLSILLKVLDEATRPLKQVGRAMSNLGRPIRQLGRDYQELGRRAGVAGKRMKDLGSKMMMRMTLPMAAFGAASIRASMNFNEAMANIATLIPGSVKRVNELKGNVRELAVSMGKSTDDMASGLYQVISAFGDSAETVKLLEINARVAVAGLSSTEQALRLTSAVTKGYGDTTAKATEKVADLAFLTVKWGQTTIPELAAAIGQVTPVASLLGVTQEELFAGFAALAGVTGTTSEAATQLKGILAGMLKPTTEMKKAFVVLGVDSAKALIGRDGLVGALTQLMAHVKGDEQEFTKVIGGRQEALAAAFALTGKQFEDFQKKYAIMVASAEERGEAFGAAFREQAEGVNKLGFQWNQFKVRMAIFAQTVGEILMPKLIELTSKLEGLLKWWKNLDDEQKESVIRLAAVVAVIPPLLMALGTLGIVLSGVSKLMAFPLVMGLVTKLGTLKTMVWGLNLAFGGLLLPVVLVGAAIYLWWKNWDKIALSTKLLWQDVLESLKSIHSWGKKVLGLEVSKGEFSVGAAMRHRAEYGETPEIRQVAKEWLIGQRGEKGEFLAESRTETARKEKEFGARGAEDIFKQMEAGVGGFTPGALSKEAFSKMLGGAEGLKGQADLNVTVSAAPGTTATVKGAAEGDLLMKIFTEGYIGGLR